MPFDLIVAALIHSQPSKIPNIDPVRPKVSINTIPQRHHPHIPNSTYNESHVHHELTPEQFLEFANADGYVQVTNFQETPKELVSAINSSPDQAHKTWSTIVNTILESGRNNIVVIKISEKGSTYSLQPIPVVTVVLFNMSTRSVEEHYFTLQGLWVNPRK